MTNRIRHIIKPPGAYEAFRVLANKYGLKIIDKVEREPQNPIALQEVFGNAEHTVGVHYIEDGLAEIPYIQIAGPQAEHYSQLLVRGLPVFSEVELFATWDTASTLEDKIDAVLRLGVASNIEPSPPYVERIRQAFGDPAPEVRAAGLTAFAYHPWEELRSIVENMKDADADGDVRDRARVILDSWNT